MLQVTDKFPPTVALFVTAAEFRVARPEVESVDREVLPVTVRVPVTHRFPPTVSLLVTAAEFNVASPDVESVDRDEFPVTHNVPATVALFLIVTVPVTERLPQTARPFVTVIFVNVAVLENVLFPAIV